MANSGEWIGRDGAPVDWDDDEDYGQRWVQGPDGGWHLADKPTRPEVAVGVVGAAGLGIGAFLPWISATAPFVGTISRSGMDGSGPGDGIFFLILGGLALLLSINAMSKTWSSVVLSLVGVGSSVLAFYEIATVRHRINDVSTDSAAISATIGFGLWVLVIASITVFAAGAMGASRPSPSTGN